MATEVKLPEIGEGVTEGELVNWLVQVGDSIEVDQAVAEIMTDKATVEVPSPLAGKVKELKFNPGDIIEVDSVMITLEASPGATASGPKEKPAEKAAPVLTPTPAVAPTAAPAAMAAQAPAAKGMDVYPPVADIRVLATPATRRLAREMNVDINQIQGTGLAGRVTRDDVLSLKSTQGSGAIAGTPAQSGGVSWPKPAYKSAGEGIEDRVPLRGIRRKIAENMQMAKHVVPHFTLMDEANVTELVALRHSLKPQSEKLGVKITFLPFVIKALIATVRDFPMFNASIDDQAQEIVYKKYFNVGFAADTPQGLLVPVIKNAEQKSLLEISREIFDLAMKARDGKLQLDEMKGATFTVTNIGAVGGSYATPIINHPEVAIFGMYKISEKPVWQNATWVPQQFMNFTVTCDHRLIDGAVAARFLKDFVARMEAPGRMMLDMV